LLFGEVSACSASSQPPPVRHAAHTGRKRAAHGGISRRRHVEHASLSAFPVFLSLSLSEICCFEIMKYEIAEMLLLFYWATGSVLFYAQFFIFFYSVDNYALMHICRYFNGFTGAGV
jgi:hypothetical protein